MPVQVEMKLDLLLGNGNVRYAGLTNAGLHDPVVIDVLNLAAPSPSPLLEVLLRFLIEAPPRSLVGLLLHLVPPSSLGWCLVPSVRTQPRRAARPLRRRRVFLSLDGSQL